MKATLFFFLLILGSCSDNSQPAHAYDQGGNTVVRIADGDTFTLLHANNRQEKVRLYGVDAPEKGQDFGTVAKQALSDLVFGKQVRIVSKGKDKYKRTLAIVYLADGRCVNEELLKSGMVWHFKRFDNDPSWAALEAKARSSRVGLWSKADAVAPSIFREGR